MIMHQPQHTSLVQGVSKSSILFTIIMLSSIFEAFGWSKFKSLGLFWRAEILKFPKIGLNMGCVLAISKPLLYLPLHFDKILEDSIWRQVASVYIIIFLQTRTSLTTFIFFFHLSWKLSIFVMSLSQLEIPAQTFIIFIFSNIFLVLLMDSTIQILAAQS